MNRITFSVPGALWDGYLAAAYASHRDVEFSERRQGRGRRVTVTASERVARAVYRYLRDRSTIPHGSGAQSMYERYAARSAAEALREALRGAGVEVT